MPPSQPAKKMSVGERDKKMSDLASMAAEEVCRKYEEPKIQEISLSSASETILQNTLPYLTTRTLQTQKNILQNLQTDSARIKKWTVALVVLTCLLLFLTAALAYYAARLDALIPSLADLQRSNQAQLSSPLVPPSSSVSPEAPVSPSVSPSPQASINPSVSPSPQPSISVSASPSPHPSLKSSRIHHHRTRR